MPGAVPRRATTALANATLPFVLALAEARTALSPDDRVLAVVATVEAPRHVRTLAATAGRPCVPAPEALTTTAPSGISRQATTRHHPHQT
jgi:alanine dehydrogenase